MPIEVVMLQVVLPDIFSHAEYALILMLLYPYCETVDMYIKGELRHWLRLPCSFRVLGLVSKGAADRLGCGLRSRLLACLALLLAGHCLLKS